MPRVAVFSASGDVVFHIPGAAARILVDAGTFIARPSGGRVRALDLAKPASSHATRVGPPSPPAVGGTKFYRTRRLETASVYEHHPRALWR